MKPKFVTKFVDEDLSDTRAGFIQPGTVAGMNAFGGFIVSSTRTFTSLKNANPNIENQGSDWCQQTPAYQSCAYAAERASG